VADTGPNLGEASYWIMTAAALLVRRAKFNSEEWTAATQALASLTRLQDEIRNLNEVAERRDKLTALDPAIQAPAPVPDARTRTAQTRKPGATAGAGPGAGQFGEGGLA
jgi:hypothetical protein